MIISNNLTIIILSVALAVMASAFVMLVANPILVAYLPKDIISKVRPILSTATAFAVTMVLGFDNLLAVSNLTGFDFVPGVGSRVLTALSIAAISTIILENWESVRNQIEGLVLGIINRQLNTTDNDPM